MVEPLKHMYNPEFFEYFRKILKRTLPEVNETQFIHHVFDNNWPDLELKQRTRKVTLALHKVLPADFNQAADNVIKISKACLQDRYSKNTYPLIFLPEYIELYGIHHFGKSMEAIEQITQLISAEFAIRPFILKFPRETMLQMERWSLHENAHVRRLASEGCRPRLPWAMGLPAFKKNPAPIFPILENLKKDESEYVRRSVANNLNDIAKDHPEEVVKIVSAWKGLSNETNWILKHGSRTLLKKGHQHALGLHGFDKKLKASVYKLNLGNTKIKIGESGLFTFDVVNKEKKRSKLRIEYAINFKTSTGKTSRKVFKVTEKEFEAGEKITFERKQRFTDFTTRKHFPGKHQLEIIVNGMPKSTLSFDLISN